MAERPGAFLSRWSRRKREPEREAAAAEIDESATGEPVTGESVTGESVTGGPGAGDRATGDPEVVAKLPDIDSLDETSDFKPFMAEGVPEILRRRALRKLWRLNPVFAHLDGLNDYDQDFTDAATVLPNLKSIYKVGKGMLGEPEARAAPVDAGAGDGEAAGAQTAADEAQPDGLPESSPPESLPPESLPPESLPPESSARQPAAPAAPDLVARAESAAPSGPRRRRAESRRWGRSSQ